MKLLKIALPLSFFVSLAGCPMRSAVWVKSGSNATHLVFGLSSRAGNSSPVWIGAFRVDRCGDDGSDATSAGLWVIGNDSGGPVSQITYGELPAAWTQYKQPLPLRPGCYRVTISGTGRTEFEVLSDGSIRQRSAAA